MAYVQNGLLYDECKVVHNQTSDSFESTCNKVNNNQKFHIFNNMVNNINK